MWWLLCEGDDWLLILDCETRTRMTRTRRGLPSIFFTFGFNVVRDLWIRIRIWITAVRFDRRYELTADGVFDLSTFVFSTVLFGDKTSPSNLTLRFACFAGGFLRRLCSGLLLGLRSANELNHGATRSAVASEQSLLSATSSPLSPVDFYGGYAWSLFTLLSGAGNSVT